MRFFLLLFTAIAAGQVAVAANITVYENYSSWLAAVQAEQPAAVPVTETFDSGEISVPGLSVSTRSGMGSRISAGLGHISGGEWKDTVGKNAPLLYDTTTFSYSGALYGIGGEWTIWPSATGLEIWANTATTASVPIIPNSPGIAGAPSFQGWWGFVSDQPFTQVILGSDIGATTYHLDNLVLADPPLTAPEPGTGAMLVIASLLISALSLMNPAASLVRITSRLRAADAREHGESLF